MFPLEDTDNDPRAFQDGDKSISGNFERVQERHILSRPFDEFRSFERGVYHLG
jgi:hypothetical protein